MMGLRPRGAPNPNQGQNRMHHRIESLRSALREAGHDAYFSLSPPANAYLAGFFGTTSAVIVTGSEAHFLCDFRYREQAAEQVHGLEVHEVTGALETRVGERLQALGVQRPAFDAAATTVYQAETVQAAFGGALQPEPTLLAGLRQIKDATEIAKLRAASALKEGVLADLLPELKEGITEAAFAARLEFEMKCRGASGPSFSPIVLFGSRSSLPHGTPGQKPLEPGDIVLIDFGCIRDGYCSDLTRTYAFGTIPGAWFEEIYSVTLTAQLAALEAVRPGAACRDVDAVARDIIRDAGFGEHFGHGLGHGVGLEIHEAPRLNQQSNAVLQPGMAVTVEPGIYLPGRGGVRIEDLVVVTETGYERLTLSPKTLKVV
jgi:Xaa-Pro aminopeptidase